MVKSLPPLHEVAAMAGLDLPKYLGDMKLGGEAPGAPPPPPGSTEKRAGK
jgi:flotillin